MQRTLPNCVTGVTCALMFLLSGCDPEHDGGDPTPPVGPDPSPPTIQTLRGPSLAESPLLSEQAKQLPPSGSEQKPGLEREEWTVAEYGNPGQIVRLRLDTTKAEEGPVRLAVEMFGGTTYSTALCLDGEWRLSIGRDAETVLVIYNACPAALQGGLAYTLASSYIWYESRPFVLKPGWNTIRVRQGTDDFKTQSSGWQHTAGLWRPEECHGITLLLHSGRRTGRVFIDHISVAEAPARTAPTRTIFQSPK